LELDIFEQLMASSGRQIRAARVRAFTELRAAVLPAFRAMAATDLEFEAELVAESFEDEADFARILKSQRLRDRARKSASFGPQRDDIRFQINGREARRHASQGQQRVLALAVKMAELACVRRARGSEPILLLDDVSSELDPERTGAVYDFVREANGQVLVTTTRPELFSTPSLGDGQRCDFRLAAGSLQG
jgi:DNA replication and repair protein RecF